MNQKTDTTILIHPRRGRKESPVPRAGVLVVNPSEAKICHQQILQAGGESRHLFNSELTVAADRSFFVAGPSIGAPMAAMSMEKLIVLGGKRIILFGWCGAISKDLRIGDILVPNQALSGEGTSAYYPLEFPPVPSSSLCGEMENAFLNRRLQVKKGCVWSTDAIYREDRNALQELNATAGVAAVDMEFSALCSVACFRAVDFAAVLVVSDELWDEKWRPGFSMDIFKERKATALELVLSTLA